MYIRYYWVHVHVHTRDSKKTISTIVEKYTRIYVCMCARLLLGAMHTYTGTRYASCTVYQCLIYRPDTNLMYKSNQAWATAVESSWICGGRAARHICLFHSVHVLNYVLVLFWDSTPVLIKLLRLGSTMLCLYVCMYVKPYMHIQVVVVMCRLLAMYLPSSTYISSHTHIHSLYQSLTEGTWWRL